MSNITLRSAGGAMTIDQRTWAVIRMECRAAGLRLPARRFNVRLSYKVAEVIDQMVDVLSECHKKRPGVPVRGPLALFDSRDGVNLICDLGDFIELAAEGDGFVVESESGPEGGRRAVPASAREGCGARST